MEVILSEVQILDLLLRIAAVGQLALLIVFQVNKDDSHTMPKVLLMACVMGYIMLTAPIENKHYGGLRHILLLLTDLTPLAILWYTLIQLDNKFRLISLPRLILIPLVIWVLALVYFFLVLGGRGLLHDINHGVGMAVLVAIIYLCISDYIDDLDNDRRNMRMLLVSLVSLYMSGLVLFEFVLKNLRDTWQFSLINAFVIFLTVFIISSVAILQKKNKAHVSGSGDNNSINSDSQHDAIISKEQEQLTILTKLMDQGAYLQSELTIGKLAKQLNIQEHQLRSLINQHLGFSNFSHYLNSYRIPWVCRQLKDPSRKEPVLTLALEAGYGSIAPFNRAFKIQIGVTPTQYRDQFQK